MLGMATMVFVIVVIGGITRLTESGLSITEWKPITGAIPPLNEADWVAAFEKYKRIPEYTEINGPAGMTLAGFKTIYFWEWAHRLWARLIGYALLLPWLWFATCALLGKSGNGGLRGWLGGFRLPPGYLLRIFALGMLVALQATIGWWMVSSGLLVGTDVSHFRLATHLLVALLTMAGMLWTALDLFSLTKDANARPARLTGYALAILSVLVIQLLLGAWVAGLNAGYVSNSWPLMNGRLYPEGIDWNKGGWYALTHDPFLLHFLHRWWAWIAVAALVLMARKLRAPGDRRISVAIHSAFGVQILLGIATVMTGMNIILAVLHQAVGALVVASAVWGAHRLGSDKA
ncbi:MAG: COX15/CtaA family protein [Sphingomonadales bacterium]|nr:COX15/CtaA family protein [Sphingomonadales bacterium]